MPLNVDLQAGSAGNISISKSITTFGGSFNGSGADFDNTGGAITTAGGAATLNHSGSVTIGAAIDASGAGNGALAVTAGTIALGANLKGSGSLSLQPFSSTATIRLGDVAAGAAAPGDLALDNTEVSKIQNGFTGITIGHSSGTGPVIIDGTAGGLTFNDARSLAVDRWRDGARSRARDFARRCAKRGDARHERHGHHVT